MKPLALILLALISTLLLVFLAPHHRRNANNPKPCTLWEVYRDALPDLPSNIQGRGGAWLALFALAAVWAAVFPALFFLALHWMAPVPGRGAVYITVGVLAGGGAVINFIVITLFVVSEEIGFRGYLLPRLQELGNTRAILLSGFLHGVLFFFPVSRQITGVPVFHSSLNVDALHLPHRSLVVRLRLCQRWQGQ